MVFTTYDSEIKAFYKGIFVAELLSLFVEKEKVQLIFELFDRDNYVNEAGGNPEKQIEPLDIKIRLGSLPIIELKQVQITHTNYGSKREFETCNDIVKDETYYATHPLEIK